MEVSIDKSVVEYRKPQVIFKGVVGIDLEDISTKDNSIGGTIERVDNFGFGPDALQKAWRVLMIALQLPGVE